MSFTSASRLAPRGEGRFSGPIDPRWMQGRGAVGGLSVALLARALEHEAPDGLVLRSLFVAFTAPARGEVEVVVERERVGRHVATMRASMRGGELFSTALATLVRPRAGGLRHDELARPDVPPPEEVPDGPEPHYYPDFARCFFEFRQCLGPLPFSGAAEAHVGGYCRLKDPTVPVDRALVLAMLDAWPPAAAARSPGWCPVASIELGAHLIADPTGIAPGSWLFYEARSRHVEGGLADEEATLWGPDGQALATARQLIAIFPPDPASTPAPRAP